MCHKRASGVHPYTLTRTNLAPIPDPWVMPPPIPPFSSWGSRPLDSPIGGLPSPSAGSGGREPPEGTGGWSPQGSSSGEKIPSQPCKSLVYSESWVYLRLWMHPGLRVSPGRRVLWVASSCFRAFRRRFWQFDLNGSNVGLFIFVCFKHRTNIVWAEGPDYFWTRFWAQAGSE